MPALSVVIITLNEEKNIARCLGSAMAVGDEIIVADTGSTDNTVSIATSMGAKVLRLEFKGYGETKNNANQLATHDFILWMDADETLDKTATDAVIDWKNNFKTENEAACLNRLNKIEEKWIRHGDWYPDAKVRIFNRNVFSWDLKAVHESLKTNTQIETKKLPGNVLHYAYDNLHELEEKTKRYALLASTENRYKSKPLALLSAFIRFSKAYILKQGFRDGKIGFEIAKINAIGTYWKYTLNSKL
jgi:glycosyltransferase involved in cell wall biosynthesis